MTRDTFAFTSSGERDEGEGLPRTWIQKVQLAGGTPVKTWTKNIDNSEAHKPHNEQTRIEGKLPVGAYLLEAKREIGVSARRCSVVSDATLVP